MLGIERSGKTALRSILCEDESIKPDPDDYCQTEGEPCSTTHLEVNGTEYNIKIWDCSGDNFKNARATAASYLSRAAIHCLVVTTQDPESLEYLEGIVKGIGIKEEFLPKHKLFVVTHTDEGDDDEIVEKTQKVAKANNMECYDCNCLEDGETMRSSLSDFLKKVLTETPEFKTGCEYKGGEEAPKKKSAEEKKPGKEKKDKKEKKEKKSGEKKGCVLL